MCFTCGLLLISSCASSPSNPSALLANGMLCRALYCSSWIQLSHDVVIGISARVLRLDRLRRRHDLGPGRRRLVRIEACLAERILAVPHHGGRRIERHRRHPPVRQAVVAAHRRDIRLRIDRDAGLLDQLPHLLRRLAGGQHRSGADLEDLRQMRRLAGAERGDRRGQHIGIAALVDRLHLDRVLALVERLDQMVHLLAERRGHRVPPDDLGLLGGATDTGTRPGQRCRRATCDASCSVSRSLTRRNDAALRSYDG